jgi:cobalt-precorrin-7 (C5)-methyltransferase
MGWIVVISFGPGAGEYITDVAKQKVQNCDVIVGSKMQLEVIKPLSNQEVFEETDIERILQFIDKNHHKQVGVLVTGDAGLYSLAQRIIDRFGKEAVKEIVPGVSSLQVAFARLKESWLNVRVFSYHGRTIRGLEKILNHHKVAILCDREHNSKIVLQKLKEHGLFKKPRRIYVCQELTLPEEKIFEVFSEEDIEKIIPQRREIIIIIHGQGGQYDTD